MSNIDPCVSNVSPQSSLPWRVVRVKTGAEFEVGERIADMGFETYCPRLILTRRTQFQPSNSRRAPIRALFDGYICAKLRPDARLGRLARLGLLYRVFFQTALSEAQIRLVRVVELEAAALAARKVKIRPGDFGTIMIGVLKNEPIEVLQIRKQKVLVKLTRFDAKSAPVTVSIDSVAVPA